MIHTHTNTHTHSVHTHVTHTHTHTHIIGICRHTWYQNWINVPSSSKCCFRVATVEAVFLQKRIFEIISMSAHFSNKGLATFPPIFEILWGIDDFWHFFRKKLDYFCKTTDLSGKVIYIAFSDRARLMLMVSSSQKISSSAVGIYF